MKPNVIVWDLETVPDLGGFAAANNLVGKSDVEVREAIGDKFPKHIYHSIVCIGALIAHREPDHWAVDAVGAPQVGERTEKQLITALIGKLLQLCNQMLCKDRIMITCFKNGAGACDGLFRAFSS